MTEEWRTRRSSVDTGELYEHVRQRFVKTINALTATDMLARVPATPAWSVHDVLAHVVGLASELNAQHFPDIDDVGGSRWAEQQVAARRAVPTVDIVATWDREAPDFETGLRIFGYETGCHFVADLHAHHQDVRGALGLSHDDDALTVSVSLDHYLSFIDVMLKTSTWGTLDVFAGAERRRLGVDGRCRAQVAGSAFDILRAFSARRSAPQIRQLQWTGDVGPLLAQLATGFSGGYAIPHTALHE